MVEDNLFLRRWGAWLGKNRSRVSFPLRTRYDGIVDMRNWKYTKRQEESRCLKAVTTGEMEVRGSNEDGEAVGQVLFFLFVLSKGKSLGAIKGNRGVRLFLAVRIGSLVDDWVRRSSHVMACPNRNRSPKKWRFLSILIWTRNEGNEQLLAFSDAYNASP